MPYFVINSSDGDTFVSVYKSKKELLNSIDLNASYFDIGKFPYDTNYWDKGLIIKGEIVAPMPKKTIVEYDIE